MDLKRSTVAVTGATGFLGRHLCRALLDRGARVVGVARNPGRATDLADRGVVLRAADLADPAALAAAFDGADAVIANAALSIRGRAPYAEFVAANLEGAENQLRAAADAGVRRLVHISTIAVHRPRLNRVNADPAALLDGLPISWSFAVTSWRYALSKAHGERRVRALGGELGVGVTVLRPGPIYGSGDHKVVPIYGRLAQAPVLAVPTARIPHVHARDVADAAGGALANDAAIGRAYDVAGPPTSPLEVLRAWRAVTGRGPRLLPIPVPLWLAFDDTDARRDLGYAPRGIEAGLREALGGAADPS